MYSIMFCGLQKCYSGTKLESIILFFCFFLCSHVYLLNYRSEVAQVWRQDTDTIHDHNHTKKMQVRSVIMGRNGRVVLGAYFQMVFSTDLAHFVYSRPTIHHTPSVWT